MSGCRRLTGGEQIVERLAALTSLLVVSSQRRGVLVKPIRVEDLDRFGDLAMDVPTVFAENRLVAHIVDEGMAEAERVAFVVAGLREMEKRYQERRDA